MMISSFSNSSNDITNIQRWPLSILGYALLMLLGGLVGCSSSTSADICAAEDAPESDTIADDVIKISQVTLESKRVYDNTGSTTDTESIRATVSDRSLGYAVSRPPTSCCGVLYCYLLTGIPVPTCREADASNCGNEGSCAEGETCVDGTCTPCSAQPLAIDSATIDGLTSEPLELTQIGDDGSKWAGQGIQDPLWGDAITVSVQVEGQNTDDRFPNYSQSISAPTPLVLNSPDLTAAPIQAGSVDLPLKWEPGNGDRMEVLLSATDDSENEVTDSIVCVGADDGCMMIPAGAIDTITQGLSDDAKVNISVRRVISETTTVTETPTPAVAQIKARARIDFQVEP